MAARKRKKQREEFVDYIAIIDRTDLHYSINHHRIGRSRIKPYHRSLYLYGELVHPKQMAGTKVNALLLAAPSLAEIPELEIGLIVGTIMKHGGELQFVAEVPLEFIASLSAAFHDKRLQILWGRGSPLKRGNSLLIDISFRDRQSIEDEWGEPLVTPTNP